MDEPYYIPRYIDNILAKLDKEIVEVVKVYALPPNIHKMNYLQTVRYYFSYFGTVVFSYMVLLRVFYILYDFVNQHFKLSDCFHSVEHVCEKFGIAFSKIDKINSEGILDEMRKLRPDIIFSVACPQIFGIKLISIPANCCLNIHSSLLPKYRGLNANFWVLARGEKITGVTIHYVNPGIDEGDILLQERIEIDDKWSLNDLYLKVIQVGSDMIAKCFKLIYEDKVITQRNDISKGSYFSFPTKKDVKEFRRRGKRFFKFC